MKEVRPWQEVDHHWKRPYDLQVLQYEGNFPLVVMGNGARGWDMVM